MSFSYLNYVQRFKYKAYQWPPDIGLAELHSRCSQPGLINPQGVKCPCCSQQSKHKIKSWWKRSIEQDFSGAAGAVCGYFFLLKYYLFCIFLVLCINSIYPMYCTYIACLYYDQNSNYCVKSGLLVYLQYNQLLSILSANGHNVMVQVLQTLQIVVFYLLLIANNASVILIARLQNKQQRKQNHRNGNNVLLIHGLKQQYIETIHDYLKIDKSISIIRVIPLKQIKKYYQLFHYRNKVYYSLMSQYVWCEDPYKSIKRNMKLKQIVYQMNQQKKKFEEYCDRVLVVFANSQMANIVSQMYRFPEWKKWVDGVKYIAEQNGLSNIRSLPIMSMRVPQSNSIKWENLGEDNGRKMAARIKTFFISIALIILCYLLLYIPMKYSLQKHTQSVFDAQLSTLQKIIPIITSLVLFGLSILFRYYMQILGEKRNPKNQMEKSKFVLVNCVLFHFIFYLIIPTIYFTFNNGINQSIKLYVVAEQARTFVFFQMILSIIDMPYRIWRAKRSRSLSDQRQGFKNCQIMLNYKVEYRDYPLQMRLQTLFRIWSFALFYSFFLPYMMIYMFVALIVLYWLEKRNLYFHYTLRKKIDISLETQFLKIYINFFCIYQCFIYVFNAEDSWKIIAAIVITVICIIGNIVYWWCMRPSHSTDKKSQQPLIDNLDGMDYKVGYQSFLQSVQIEQLDEQIKQYVSKLPEQQQQRNKNKINLEMQAFQTEMDSDGQN